MKRTFSAHKKHTYRKALTVTTGNRFSVHVPKFFSAGSNMKQKTVISYVCTYFKVEHTPKLFKYWLVTEDHSAMK